MTETQILFRVDKDTLKALDRALSAEGFRTRNEWFRSQVREFLEESKRKQLADRLERLAIEDVKEGDILEMIREWRAKKGKR